VIIPVDFGECLDEFIGTEHVVKLVHDAGLLVRSGWAV
jgi:hypothetical protein